MLPDDFNELDPRLQATAAMVERAKLEFIPQSQDLDRQAAEAVREAVAALNVVLAEADKRGLDVDISFRETSQQFVLLRVSKTL